MTDQLFDLEGCYLHYNMVKCAWKRSGKAAGLDLSVPRRGFGNRQNEHEKCSAAVTKSSNFYRIYPNKGTNNSNDEIRTSYFHHLQQYCGIGFERDKCLHGLLCNEKGILYWDEETLERIGKLKFSNCISLREKQLVMVAYLFELGYDLMISENDNVSSSPGFELPLGIFGDSD